MPNINSESAPKKVTRNSGKSAASTRRPASNNTKAKRPTRVQPASSHPPVSRLASHLALNVLRGLAWIILLRWLKWVPQRFRPAAVLAAVLVAFALIAVTVTFLQMTIFAPPPIVAPLFTPEVQYWASSIRRWSAQYQVDPNLIATIMQIESCGQEGVSSSAGAQGLFQVMPMNFPIPEQVQMTDPETNAKRGIEVIQNCLTYANNDVGLALACYNGGPSRINQPFSQWPGETQRYYNWGTGIYNDAHQNASQSQTLNSWLAAGGVYMCQNAAVTLKLPTPTISPYLSVPPATSIPLSRPTLPAPLPTFVDLGSPLPTFDSNRP